MFCGSGSQAWHNCEVLFYFFVFWAENLTVDLQRKCLPHGWHCWDKFWNLLKMNLVSNHLRWMLEGRIVRGLYSSEVLKNCHRAVRENLTQPRAPPQGKPVKSLQRKARHQISTCRWAPVYAAVDSTSASPEDAHWFQFYHYKTSSGLELIPLSAVTPWSTNIEDVAEIQWVWLPVWHEEVLSSERLDFLASKTNCLVLTRHQVSKEWRQLPQGIKSLCPGFPGLLCLQAKYNLGKQSYQKVQILSK